MHHAIVCVCIFAVLIAIVAQDHGQNHYRHLHQWGLCIIGCWYRLCQKVATECNVILKVVSKPFLSSQ